MFVLILAVLFIGERLNLIEVVAFFLLLSGGFLISVRRVEEAFKISKVFYWMLFSSFLFGIYHVLTKFVYLNQAYYDGFILIRVGSFLGALSILLVKESRRGLIETFSSISNKVKGTVFVYGVFNLAGLAFFNLAISLASVSLVTASAGIQAVLVLIFASLLSFKFPSLLKEELNRKVILQKAIAIILIVVGAGVIVLG